VVFLIWYLVLLRAGVSFWVIAVSMAANIALVVYMYWTYLPPREAAWERERRRQAYFPKPGRKRKRRR
jgi:Ca2+/Na+ antiporter